MKPSRTTGAGLIFLAALAWGLGPSLNMDNFAGVDPLIVVFWGHAFGLLVLSATIWRGQKPILRPLKRQHWLALIAVAGLGEVVAGILFGISFREVGSASSTFLLMLRPFCVLPLAFVILRERKNASFIPWAVWVFVGAAAIFIFDGGTSFAQLGTASYWKSMAYGLAAVFLWSLSTVSAKWLLRDLSSRVLVFMRWVLSIIGFAAILLYRGVDLVPCHLFQPQFLVSVVVSTLFLALLPLWLYYRGLTVLSASLASFIELACPLVVVFFPVFVLGQKLHELQWFGGISIISGVFLLLQLELEIDTRPREGPGLANSGESP